MLLRYSSTSIVGYEKDNVKACAVRSDQISGISGLDRESLKSEGMVCFDKTSVQFHFERR